MMKADKDIKTATLADIEAMRRRGELHHNPDAPGLDVPADFWEKARPVVRAPKKAISLRVDPDVLDWFRKQGKGYQSRMNAVLRSYMEAQRKPR